MLKRFSWEEILTKSTRIQSLKVEALSITLQLDLAVQERP